MPKREKARTMTQEFYALRLYLDDVERIHSILAELGGKVEIVADDYELDSIDELEKLSSHNRGIKSLQIRTHAPELTIDLGPKTAVIRAVGGDASTVGVFHNCVKVLSARQNPWLRGLSEVRTEPWFIFIVAFWLVVTVLSSVFKFTQQGSPKPITLDHLQGVIVLTFALFTLLLIIANSVKQFFLYPTRSSNRIPLLVRKRDEITIAIIASTAGAILGALIHAALK